MIAASGLAPVAGAEAPSAPALFSDLTTTTELVEPVYDDSVGTLDPVLADELLVMDPALDPVVSDPTVLDATVEVPSLYPVSLTRVREEVLGKLATADAGAGIDIALIDTGVAPVAGLDLPGKLVHGPDLSLEGGSALAHVDTHGHGTFMAGIIAGDDGVDGGFLGVAPGSRLVSLKVAGADGGTDVVQLIAAIDWVVEHRNDAGLDIRVLNLSVGVPSVTDHRHDPLAAAVERAWDAGIVVVAAAGNQGETETDLDSPALDPYVIAVGATESETGRDDDDIVPAWSARGDGVRNPDVVAPGRSLLSLRAPGSSSDVAHPEARVGDRFARASGTSEAAAVVTGSVAVLLAQRPDLTPDQVKALLMDTAVDLPHPANVDGHGRIRVDRADRSPARGASQDHPRALVGVDSPFALPHGTTWTGGSWSGGSWSGGSWSSDAWLNAEWSGGSWSGGSWSGGSWSGGSWSGGSWSGGSWSGGAWSGAAWSGAAWSGAAWSGAAWSGAAWSGAAWSGAAWSGAAWSGAAWSGAAWSGAAWSGAAWSGAAWSGAAWSGAAWSGAAWS